MEVFDKAENEQKKKIVIRKGSVKLRQQRKIISLDPVLNWGNARYNIQAETKESKLGAVIIG